MDYDESSIEVLENRDAVRKRPGMFIGDTHYDGLHHILWEIVDNAVDEGINGHADLIEVCLGEDGERVSVWDNGRGIPVEEHPQAGVSTLSVVFTTLHAGGKFNDQDYKASGGLHGVGAAVTNFLSRSFRARSRRDESIWEVSFKKGRPEGEVEEVGSYSKYSNKKDQTSGTEIAFRPDPEVFESVQFDPDEIRRVLETKTYINSGLRIRFVDKTSNESYEFHHPGGIDEYLSGWVEEESFSILHDSITVGEQVDNLEFEVAFQWTEDTASSEIDSFVNAIPTEGGTHVKGFLRGVSKAVKRYIENTGKGPKSLTIRKGDIEEGLKGVLNLFYEGEIQFRGQTKNKFNNPDVTSKIASSVRSSLQQFLLNRTDTADQICQRAVRAARARNRSRSSSTSVSTTSTQQQIHLPTKLSDCASTRPSESELFIVEGSSAGGNAKQARDQSTQAILPLRGKILNAEGKSQSRVMDNKELKSIVRSLGCGIGDSFDLGNLRYGKVILLMDADDDGHHIVTLLLTFFYRHLPELIEEGHLYIAKPPLYQIFHGQDRHWAMNDEERDEKIDQLESKNSRKKIEVNRFKGLGEMQGETLWETTLNPSNRELIRVDVDDPDDLLSKIMGRGSTHRYKMIMSNLGLVEDEPV